MCGLCGVVTNTTLSKNEMESFRYLMMFSMTRGEQGAGICFIRKNQKTNIIRTAGSSAHLVTTDLFYETITKKTNQAMMGHARLPTKGKVDPKDPYANIHPHRAGSLVGMHNGTMWKVNKEYPGDESDSKMLYQSIANVGLQETVNESDGAMALNWYDEADGTLNFYRNKDRPLWLVYNKNKNTMWWASEPWMFYGSARKVGELDEVKELPVEEHWKFRMNRLDHPVVTPVRKVVKPVASFRGHRAGYMCWEDEYNDPLETALAPFHSRRRYGTYTPPLKNDSVVLPGDLQPGVGRGATVKTLGGVICFMNHQAQKLKKGCAWCGDPVSEVDLCQRKLLWIDKDNFLCSVCVNKDESSPVWEYFPGMAPSKAQLAECVTLD